jgi:hypothetical protein
METTAMTARTRVNANRTKDFPHWKTLYQVAMLELESQKINERIEAARRAIQSRGLEVKDHKLGTLGERQEIVDAISSLEYWETFTASGEGIGLPVRSATGAQAILMKAKNKRKIPRPPGRL